MNNHDPSQKKATPTQLTPSPNQLNAAKNNDLVPAVNQIEKATPVINITNDKKVIPPRPLLPRPREEHSLIKPQQDPSPAATLLPGASTFLLLPSPSSQESKPKDPTPAITTPSTAASKTTAATKITTEPSTKQQQQSRKRKSPTDESESGHHQVVKRTPETTEPATVRRATTTGGPTRTRSEEDDDDTSVDKRPRNVEKIIYGRYQIGTWYYSPYPSEYGDKVEELFICEHCLRYTVEDSQLRAHKLHCKRRRPPGQVIYQQDGIKIYEIDGREHKLYCQNLCLMSKLFLETKTLYYDVEGFTFYVLTEQDRTLDLFVGYFSKEKISYDNYNLACIMVLPPQQRKGYGRLLIELSYELSKHQGVIGSPEKPLSSLGALGYRSYWASTLIASLRDFRGQLTIQELSKRTAIHIDDVIDTLAWLGMLKYRKKNVKQEEKEKGGAAAATTAQHDGSPSGTPVQVCIKSDMLENAIAEHHLRFTKRIDPSLIRWKYTTSNATTSTSGGHHHLHPEDTIR
ncbi:acyl-CoA N-acyltransferase [Zychaea mexicana]|uniref:acyl-CoA N-acyltransferase n=1 Tax=Zychaea mexicana TaxID=64656 RepID=UPI0022FE3A29|nr:acyl-CoA N-acyltransferase [Zychaea mexicana]KAI9490623.1 acyl-CoA N-acyltransferase [Zychaea mexicana]